MKSTPKEIYYSFYKKGVEDAFKSMGEKMTDKETRKKQIKQEIKKIREETGILRYRRYALETELSYMQGHFDKSWEERYCKEKK